MKKSPPNWRWDKSDPKHSDVIQRNGKRWASLLRFSRVFPFPSPHSWVSHWIACPHPPLRCRWLTHLFLSLWPLFKPHTPMRRAYQPSARKSPGTSNTSCLMSLFPSQSASVSLLYAIAGGPRPSSHSPGSCFCILHHPHFPCNHSKSPINFAS